MPVSLDRSDRKILIGATVILVLLVGATAVLSPPQAAPAPDSSSYSPGANGAKAAYELLGELGYQVERWAQPLPELPEDAGKNVLVLSEPIGAVAISESDALERFVRRGGRVLITGPNVPKFLTGAGVSLMPPQHATTQNYQAAAVSGITRGVPIITMAATVRWDGDNADAAPMYVHGDDVVVVAYKIGDGEAIWWAGATPLSNAGISAEGNLNLLLNSLGTADGTRVLWDEYYHGERKTLGSYLAGTPVVWALLQGGIICVMIVLAYGRRTGPTRMPVVESRLSPLEFVETLGALYQSAGAASGAVKTVWDRFRYLVCTRLGLPRDANVRQMYDSARERLGWTEPGLFESMQTAERASTDVSLSSKDALRIVESIEHYAGLLELNRTGNEGTLTWRSK
jgi:uncharacterized protein DUF4350